MFRKRTTFDFNPNKDKLVVSYQLIILFVINKRIQTKQIHALDCSSEKKSLLEHQEK